MAARAAGLVLLYYGFSIGITFYNKWLMKVGAEGAGLGAGGAAQAGAGSPRGLPSAQSFAFPLFMTLLHLLVIFALSGLARRCSRRCHAAPAAGRALLPWPAYLRQVAPTGERRGRGDRGRTRARRGVRGSGRSLPGPKRGSPDGAFPARTQRCPPPWTWG